MGFYFQLNREPDKMRYAETELPLAFWILYAIAGFALACMGLAANSVLADLARIGGTFDRLLLATLFLALPVYALIGLRLWRVRKQVDLLPDCIEIRYCLGSLPLHTKRVERNEVSTLVLANERPSPNVAPTFHQDRQFFIRGHWRLGVKTSGGKVIVLDRHTEKEALEPLRMDLERWLAPLSGRTL